MKNQTIRKTLSSLLFSSAILLTQPVLAKTTVSDAWARATVTGQNMGGAYMTLKSDREARLIGASSPVSEEVQLHTMTMEGQQMVMQQVRAIELPANTTVALTGQYHLMFMGLKAPLKEGTVIPVTLKVKLPSGYVETILLQVPVKALSTR
ncbi:MAG: transporter [Burkholderiaceae bacterium]|nr:transporter [Burkholderiaceae bacterium]